MPIQKDLWVKESPMPVSGGEEIVLGIAWAGASSITNQATKVYKNGLDYSSTVHLSGDTDSVSGIIQIAKKITIKTSDFGQAYVVEFTATVDGQKLKAFWQLDIKRAGEEM